MKNSINKLVSVLMMGTLYAVCSTSALAEEWPFVEGDYWEVTGIDIHDGGGWKYTNWLADEWRKDLEFAKSKGWIKNYMVMSNVHNRNGEPDLYLITMREDIPSGEVGEKRTKEYMAWQSKSIEKMAGESGNRAEYRTVMGTSMLQVMKFRDK